MSRFPNIKGESLRVKGLTLKVSDAVWILESFVNKKKHGLSWFSMITPELYPNPYPIMIPLAEWIEENMSLTEDDRRKIKKIKSSLKGEIDSYMLSNNPRNRPYHFKPFGPLVESLVEYLKYPMDSVVKFGNFNIRTKGNPDTRASLTCLKQLSKIPFFDRFKKTLYGDILISEEDDVKWNRAKETSDWVAYYDDNQDIIRLRTSTSKVCNRQLLKTIIHELAHRYYRKFMGLFAKDAWIEYDNNIRSEGGAKELNTGDDLNNLFLIVNRDGGYSVSERPSSSDDTVKLEVGIVEGSKFWARIDKESYTSINPLIDMHLKMIFSMDPRALGPFEISKYGRLEEGLFPSIYAQTNAEEHFCEAVAYYYMGDLSDKATKHFKRVLNSGIDTRGRKVIASSQASWSILSEGVSSSRVEAHIVRNHVNQMIEAVKKNPKIAELIYKLCGDNFEAIPKHLSKMERSLDRTNYALISMGAEWYRQRLTHEDREKVDQAAKYNPTPFPSTNKQSDRNASVKRIAMRFFDDFIFDHIQDLIKLDPEFDDDSSDKSEAIWSGNFDKAKKLTRNRKAKDYIEFIKNKYTVWSEDLF